jgi:hypothetical protein
LPVYGFVFSNQVRAVSSALLSLDFLFSLSKLPCGRRLGSIS